MPRARSKRTSYSIIDADASRPTIGAKNRNIQICLVFRTLPVRRFNAQYCQLFFSRTLKKNSGIYSGLPGTAHGGWPWRMSRLCEIAEREAVERNCGLLVIRFVLEWKTNQLKGRIYGEESWLRGAGQAPRCFPPSRYSFLEGLVIVLTGVFCVVVKAVTVKVFAVSTNDVLPLF